VKQERKMVGGEGAPSVAESETWEGGGQLEGQMNPVKRDFCPSGGEKKGELGGKKSLGKRGTWRRELSFWSQKEMTEKLLERGGTGEGSGRFGGVFWEEEEQKSGSPLKGLEKKAEKGGGGGGGDCERGQKS